MVGGARVDWQPRAVMITPPGDVHSHHNEGDELALFLIVQDGGLHYHCRTMGFSFAEAVQITGASIGPPTNCP